MEMVILFRTETQQTKRLSWA